MRNLSTHKGGCHCGAVQFEILAPTTITVQRCNCSICSMTGFVHLIVPAANFSLLCDEDRLTLYQFNTKTARHLFCSQCGVKSYYVPRSNPDGYSINVNCLNQSTFEHINIEDFDGANWEQNASSLAHLSKVDQ
jgi:hypothetical protein